MPTVRLPLGAPGLSGNDGRLRAAFHWDLLAALLTGLYIGSVFPFITRIARADLGAQAWELSILTAAPFLGNLATPFWATRMEGRSTMPFLMWAWLPARALLFTAPWLGTSQTFVATIAGLQCIGAFASPAYAAVVREIYPDNARGRLMGMVRVVAQSAAFIGAQCAGRLMDHGTDFHVLFPLAGVLGIAGALSFRQVDRFRTRAPSSPMAPAGAEGSSRMAVKGWIDLLRSDRGYGLFSLSVMVYGFGNLISVPLYALFQVDVLGLSNVKIAFLANIASLAAIPASIFWGRYMDRFGPSRTCAYSILCVGAVGAAYLVGGDWTALMVAAVFSGIGFAGVELSYLQSILRFAGSGDRAARYQALHSFQLGVRGVIAPALGLHLLPFIGYRPLFVVTFLLIVVGAWIQFRVPEAVERVTP